MQEEWIELESKKFGVFWLNKTTGEIALQQGEERSEVIVGGADGSSLVEGGRARKKSRSKKKRVSGISLAISKTLVGYIVAEAQKEVHRK